ncbi:MAG: MMPL family transporter [Treponemataceae bacterium]|nr:MMPL family transporter [Treponemataceae bacterium]
MKRLFKHPWLIVTVIGCITVFFALQLPRAQLDNNNFRFVPEKDPERLLSKKIDETFGSQVFILVGLERTYDSILEKEFLATLRAYIDQVEQLPKVDSVQSLMSTDYITGTADTIKVEPLVPKDFTGTPAEVQALKERLLSWDLYSRSLVSEDFRSTEVLITLKVTAEDAGSQEIIDTYNRIKKLAHEAGFKDTNIYFAGIPVLSVEINNAVHKDLITLIPLVVIVVITVLFLSFRRLGGVLLPLLTVLISTIWAMGAMPLLHIKLSILSTVLPVILVAVGSAYGIHLVNHYYDEIDKKGPFTRETYREAIYNLLRRVGRPVLLAALTTFAGFVSFCFTPVVPIFEFGIFSSFGVLVALGVAVTLIPALYLIRGPEGGYQTDTASLPIGEASSREFSSSTSETGRTSPTSSETRNTQSEDRFSTIVANLFLAIARKKKTVLGLAALIAVFSLISLRSLIVDNVLVEYFRSTTDVARSDAFIREQFGGSKVVSVVVSSPTPGRVLHPDVLVPLDGLSRYVSESVPEVGKVMGFPDLVKRINQVFHAETIAGEESRSVVSPGAAAPSNQKTGTSEENTGEPAFGFAASEEPAFGFGFAPSSQENSQGAGSVKTNAQRPAPPSADQGLSSSEKAGSAAGHSTASGSSTPQDIAALLSRARAGSRGSLKTAEDLIKAVYRELNYQGYGYYEIPQDPARYGKTTRDELQGLIANYLVLLSGDISSYANDPLEPTAVRLNILLRTVGQIDTNRAIRAIKEYCHDRFPADVTIEVGGTALIEGSLNNLVVQSQLVSIAVSLLLVFGILTFYYRSAIAGLIGLVPLSISSLINFAFMSFFGIKLNIATALVASVSVGIGIDYTIHYLAAYHHEWLRHGGDPDFLRRTFLSSGKAIIFNAASVGAGFAVLMLSQFNILADLGLLYALTMATSAFAALTVLPVLLQIFKPAFITRPLRWDEE